jgi:hypothetical protein
MRDIPPSEPDLKALEAAIDHWLMEQLATNPVVDTVEADIYVPRAWFVRLRGEQKEAYTVRFHLRQRTVLFETYFMPAPAENQAELYAHLLRRNATMYGASFVLGQEDAVYIQGRLDNDLVPIERLADELDRILGSIYQWVEQFFQPALRIGFASRFEGR